MFTSTLKNLHRVLCFYAARRLYTNVGFWLYRQNMLAFHFIDSKHVAIPVYTRLFSIKSAAKHLASCTLGVANSYTPNHPPLQLTFFSAGFRQVSARFPPGSARFRRVPPGSAGFRRFRRVPLGSAAPPGAARFRWVPGFRQFSSTGLCRVLPGFRQQGSCSRFTLQSIARIVQGSCQAFAKVAAVKVKEAVFANARTLRKSAHGKKHR